MHQSWFSYSISKPYPFRWFTPVALVGGLVLAVVVSLFNLSANGYYLKTIYTSDPNGTVAHANALWFRKRPFNWQDDVQAECQPHLLAVGDSFFTSNLGLRYTVRTIADKDSRSRSTMSYKNNTLTDCVPTTIELRLRKVDTAVPPAAPWWMSWTDSTMTATLDCVVVTDDGPMTVTLVAADTGSGDHTYDYVVDDDSARGGFWWGTRLLNAYWNGVMTTAAHMTNLDGSKRYVVRAGFTYTPNPSQKDIRTNTFFSHYWWLANDDSSISNKGEKDGLEKYNSNKWYGSASLTEGLHTAKILHSLLSLDLGNCRAPSLLLDDDSLRYAILAPDDSFRARGALLNGSTAQMFGYDRYSMIPSPERANITNLEGLVYLKDAYGALRNLTGPLGCTNATIVTQYICSVPQQKSWGVMFFSILLADLVFLQAAWKILSWTADMFVPRGNPEAMSCQGHQQHPGLVRDSSYQQLLDGPKPAEHELDSISDGRWQMRTERVGLWNVNA
ncbi:hypothetical protein CSOJ01_11053 [Colletotrichum sojae]|uniref:Uncharacterized protein n=1 Tax=Colletotrichum sojae TaxID=2175907 RepID=A0A8H6IYV1_9PEZI|nr:hypothetical protein CSOJ01_11053 [Colletotrichum sojae]